MAQPAIVILLMAVSTTARSDPRPASEVVSAVIAAQGRVSTLLVDYYLASAQDRGPEERSRFVEGYAAGRRFTDSIHHASPARPAWLDPERRREWAGPEGTTLYSVFERTAVVSPPAEATPPPASPFLDCIGWWPGGGQPSPPPGTRPRAVVDALDAGSSSVELAPDRESIDGLTCDVLIADGGRDRIWVCPERGYAVVRRTVRLSSGAGVLVEFRNSDFAEIVPGVWLPRRCDGELRWDAGPVRRRAYRIDVVHLAVNDGVSDDQFRPDFEPGTLVYDKDRRLIESLPGGTELLDLWAAVCLVSTPPRGSPISPQSSPYPAIFVGVLLTAWGLRLSLTPASRTRGTTSDTLSNAVPARPGR